MNGAKMNAEIQGWAKNTKDDLTTSFDRLGIKHSPHSPSPVAARELLRALTAMRQGLITKVSFRFPRHMVFVQKGVGKGVPAGHTGPTRRRPKDWFNSVIDKDIEKLSEIVANNQADLIVNNFNIK